MMSDANSDLTVSSRRLSHASFSWSAISIDWTAAVNSSTYVNADEYEKNVTRRAEPESRSSVAPVAGTWWVPQYAYVLISIVSDVR